MSSLFKDWAIARGERPIANSSKMRRTIAASALLMLRSPITGVNGTMVTSPLDFILGRHENWATGSGASEPRPGSSSEVRGDGTAKPSSVFGHDETDQRSGWHACQGVPSNFFCGFLTIGVGLLT